MSAEVKKAIVIGAGFGGMSSALRLRAKGYDVHIIDQCSNLGGRAQTYEYEGFIHDAGPTVITAPFLFEEIFNLFNKKFNDYVTLKPLNPWYRFVFPDGRHFDYGGTIDDTLIEIEKFNRNDKQNYIRLVESSRKIFEVGFVKLASKPFHKLTQMLAILPALVRLKGYQSVWSFVCNHLEDNSLRQAFSIQPLLVGGNPFDTTSIYSLIHYLERKWGIFFAMGGTGAIVAAFEKLMREEGIKISLSTPVSTLKINNKKCEGVILQDGGFLEADIIISNADPSHLYANMVKSHEQGLSARLKNRNAKFSMGLYVLYFGTNRKYNDVVHHTIWLGKRYKDLLDDIFNKKIITEDFSLYLHRPTATDPSFAPEGCDSFYVLTPVPNMQGDINWDIEGPKLRNRIVKALNDTILPDLENTITSDFYKTPQDFQQTYSSMHGAGFSIAPILSQSAWFRFHNKAEGIQNLYLSGAGTHPGAGLPGVITSAKVLDELIPVAVKNG
jgi:phytoene desaturase